MKRNLHLFFFKITFIGKKYRFLCDKYVIFTQNSMISYEQTSKKIGIIATVSIHILLLILFILVAASSNNEEIPLEFGVAVNYGTSDEGFGTQQNYNTPSNNPNNETQKASTQTEVKTTEFVENKVVTPKTNTETSPVEKQSKADLLTSQDKEATPVPTEVKQERPSQTVEKQRTNPTTIITKGNTGGTEDGKSNQGGGNNNGNKEGTVGDMGKTNGDINADALLGNGGTGGGASLEMSGWVWDEKPVVNDKSAETGKIVFEIKIDDDGDVISVKNIYSTVSRSVANLYEKAIYDLTFSPTIDNGVKSSVTTGKIVFIIKSR